MFSAPWYQPVNGGISQTASGSSIETIASMSLSQNACHVAVQQLAPVVGEVVLDGVRRTAPPRRACAWARWRALFTAAVVVSSASATSAGPPAQHVAQDQHRALPGGQVLEGGDEGEPDAVARSATTAERVGGGAGVEHARRGPARSHGTSPFSSTGSSPACPTGAPSPVGQRPAAAALEGGQADVGGDPVAARCGPTTGPRTSGRPARRAGRSPGPGPRPRDRAGHPVAVREQLASVALGHLVELLGGLAVGLWVWVISVSCPRVPP